MNIVQSMIDWEGDELEFDQAVEMFQELVNSGLACDLPSASPNEKLRQFFGQLQGAYGRTATNLIRQGLVTLPEAGFRE